MKDELGIYVIVQLELFGIDRSKGGDLVEEKGNIF